MEHWTVQKISCFVIILTIYCQHNRPEADQACMNYEKCMRIVVKRKSWKISQLPIDSQNAGVSVTPQTKPNQTKPYHVVNWILCMVWYTESRKGWKINNRTSRILIFNPFVFTLLGSILFLDTRVFYYYCWKKWSQLLINRVIMSFRRTNLIFFFKK